MTDKHIADEPAPEGGRVSVVTTETGTNRYRIVATATFESAPAEVWKLLWDWERLVAVGLPGLTSDFQWLSGGPDEAPSTFQFTMAGATIQEEIYERWADQHAGRYRLRYRALEPALGVLEYDAVIELERLPGTATAFRAVREVRLEPGTPADMLAGIVSSETQYLKDHFAA